MLPKDPMILLSYLNTHLRDDYPTLDALCEDLRQVVCLMTDNGLHQSL